MHPSTEGGEYDTHQRFHQHTNTHAHPGLDIRDFGDVEEKCSDGQEAEISLGPDGERNHTAVLEYNRRLAASVSQVVKEGRVCVTLGGDHSITIGTLNGHVAAVPDQQVRRC